MGTGLAEGFDTDGGSLEMETGLAEGFDMDFER
jgi:hypothetical protein